MFYYLSQFTEYISELNLFRYITFRTAMSCVTSFLLCLGLGSIFIKIFKKKNIHERTSREHCQNLEPFQQKKQGIPTMGGLFIVVSILFTTMLWTDLNNRYVVLSMFTILSLAALGFVDDWMKYKNIGKRGLSAKAKLLIQVLIGCFIGSYVYFNPDTSTTVHAPFLKNVIIEMGWLYVVFVALIVIGSSNAVNLTDGLDGLAIGCVLVVTVTLAILSYIVGHKVFCEHLFIPHVPQAGELAVLCSAIFGASLGFLWFNSHPASVFMGDVGSLSLGGTLGVIAVFIKKELLLGLIGGVFVIEAMSVIIQVGYFKMTGKRVFKMAPFHHHLQLSGWPESKIIIRLWIISVVMSLIALTTLKVR